MVLSLGRRGMPKFSAHIRRPPEHNAKSSSFDWPWVSAIASTLCTPKNAEVADVPKLGHALAERLFHFAGGANVRHETVQEL